MRDDGDNDGLLVVLTVPAAALATDDGGSLPAATSRVEAESAAAVDNGWKYGCWRTASASLMRCDGSYSSIFSMRSNNWR